MKHCILRLNPIVKTSWKLSSWRSRSDTKDLWEHREILGLTPTRRERRLRMATIISIQGVWQRKFTPSIEISKKSKIWPWNIWS